MPDSYANILHKILLSAAVTLGIAIGQLIASRLF